MRRILWTLLAVLTTLPATAWAQTDDLYYLPKKEKAKTTVATTERNTATKSPSNAQTIVVRDVKGNVRNVDEYNRRYSSRDYQISTSNDTVYLDERPYNERGEWVNGFNGSEDDYEYAMRLVRFRNPRYAISVSSPLYWDVVYGGYGMWDWNVYDDGMYAYVFPTYTNRLWWDWRWNRWGFGWYNSWYAPYYSSWYYPYYGYSYWGGFWSPYYGHHYYPYYGWGGGYYHRGSNYNHRRDYRSIGDDTRMRTADGGYTRTGARVVQSNANNSYSNVRTNQGSMNNNYYERTVHTGTRVVRDQGGSGYTPLNGTTRDMSGTTRGTSGYTRSSQVNSQGSTSYSRPSSTRSTSTFSTSSAERMQQMRSSSSSRGSSGAFSSGASSRGGGFSSGGGAATRSSGGTSTRTGGSRTR